jgi:hypothetical protein
MPSYRHAAVAAALLLCLVDLAPALAGETSIVSSNIIKSAGDANLANGNGDVSATGGEIKHMAIAQHMACPDQRHALPGCRGVQEGYHVVLQGHHGRGGPPGGLPDQEDPHTEARQQRR